jgi:hypothetical protein
MFLADNRNKNQKRSGVDNFTVAKLLASGAFVSLRGFVF